MAQLAVINEIITPITQVAYHYKPQKITVMFPLPHLARQLLPWNWRWSSYVPYEHRKNSGPSLALSGVGQTLLDFGPHAAGEKPPDR
jgi:hypothetical protein